MAASGPTGVHEDPERTDVLPALAAEAEDEAPVESPTLEAPVLAGDVDGLEATQPRLAATPAPAGAREPGQELAAAAATIAGLEDRQRRLVAELESLRQLVPGVERAAVEPLRAELAQLQATVAEHAAERGGWREARDAAFADVQRLSRELAAADEALATLRRELATTRGALERTRALLLEREAQVTLLRARLADEGLPVAAGPPPVPTLVALDGAPPGAWRLGARTRLGRADDNEIVLDAASVSRHHAIVTAGPRGVFVEDLNSVNGVYVNRRRVRQARLADGDVVALGSVTFRYSGPVASGEPSEAGTTRSA